MKVRIESARLIMSPISLDDLLKIHELHSLPETDKYNTLGIPENLDVTKSILIDWIDNNLQENKSLTFKIEHKDNLQFIGLIALNFGKPKFKTAEVWYKIHSNFWNQGYATESLYKLLAFGFKELNLHRIEAGCAIENISSIRVLEKVGMRKEGRKRKILPLKTGWSDNFHYAILSSEFTNNSSI